MRRHIQSANRFSGSSSPVQFIYSQTWNYHLSLSLCIYTYTRTHTQTHIYIYIYVQFYIICLYLSLHLSLSFCICIYIHTHTHIYIYIYLCLLWSLFCGTFSNRCFLHWNAKIFGNMRATSASAATRVLSPMFLPRRRLSGGSWWRWLLSHGKRQSWLKASFIVSRSSHHNCFPIYHHIPS